MKHTYKKYISRRKKRAACIILALGILLGLVSTCGDSTVSELTLTALSLAAIALALFGFCWLSYIESIERMNGDRTSKVLLWRDDK